MIRGVGDTRSRYLKKKICLASTLCLLFVKGHGNEADFLGFLQKLVPHESLTLPFKAQYLEGCLISAYLTMEVHSKTARDFQKA